MAIWARTPAVLEISGRPRQPESLPWFLEDKNNGLRNQK